MQHYDFSKPDDFDACLQEFFGSHPAWHAKSRAVAVQTGSTGPWISVEMMSAFVGWARRQRYLSGTEGQRLLTTMRQMEHAFHNQQQWGEASDV